MARNTFHTCTADYDACPVIHSHVCPNFRHPYLPRPDPNSTYNHQCALQQPPIEFEDVTGKEEMFDPENHRELARFMEPDDTEINSTCCIVFPSTLAAKAKWPPSDTAKSGVIIWSQKYFKL